jgi:hypothetical protein
MNDMNNDTPNIPIPLRLDLLADSAPPSDLWSRIESAHRGRIVQRRKRRLGAATLACAMAGVLTFGFVQLRSPHPERVDWQARAEALELQLQALKGDSQIGANSASELESELGDIDRTLQTAYETGAPANELTPLWKRRSELLDTLIVARKQNLLLTRI